MFHGRAMLTLQGVKKNVPYSLQYAAIAFAANSAVPGPPAALMLAVNSPPAPYIWPSWAKISFVQV